MPRDLLTPSSRARAARSITRVVVVAALALATACGDDEKPSTTSVPESVLPGVDASVGVGLDAALSPAPTTDAGANSASDAAGQQTPTPVTPVQPAPNNKYLVASWISAGDVTNAFVKKVDRLDVDTKIDLKTDSIPVPSYGDMVVIGDKLFTSSGEEAIVKRYAIGKDGKFTEEATIGFADHASSAVLYQQAIVSPQKAYLTGDNGWVVWNPSTMKITGTIPFPAELGKKDGFDPFYAYDRGFVVRGNRVYQGVSWFDYTNFKSTPNSKIVVIDSDTDKVLSILDAPCPDIEGASIDEAGNIYFSGWTYNPAATLINGGAKGCALKLPAGSDQLDPSFKLTFAEITGGHEAAALRSIGGNKFIMAVFHEELKAYDPKASTISEWVFSNLWTFATYDIVTKEFKELPALGKHSGSYYSALLAGQFYLLANNAATSTTDFILLQQDGTTKKGITVDGWSSRAVLAPGN